MTENTINLAAGGFVPGQSHMQKLQSALTRGASDLCALISTEVCLVYVFTDARQLLPLAAGGELSDAERNWFFATGISATDALIRYVLARPESLSHAFEATDPHWQASAFNVFQAQSVSITSVMNGPDLTGFVFLVRRAASAVFLGPVVRQVEWFAASIALLLENSRLYRHCLDLLAENEALHQVTLATLQKMELDEVLRIVCDEAVKMTAADGGSIALLETNSWMRIFYCSGESPDRPGRIRASRSHLGRAIHHRTNPLLIHRPDGHSDGFSRLAVPLQARGNTIGLLTLFRKVDFDADNVRLMEIFASQAAIAIDHAQLTRMVQEMAILEERHRLSRELHDSVNQLLYGISLYTEAALRQMDQGNLEAARRYLKNIEESDQAALKEMRMLIFGLRPSGLAQMGLQASLAQRLKSVEEKLGLQPSFKWRVLLPLETEVEEVLYGIAQEALNNVIRHANARVVSVRVAESDRLVTMTIKDDGDGFDPNIVTSGGMGLKTMRERAAGLNARLRIESQPGQGTQVKVEVTR